MAHFNYEMLRQAEAEMFPHTRPIIPMVLINNTKSDTFDTISYEWECQELAFLTNKHQPKIAHEIIAHIKKWCEIGTKAEQCNKKTFRIDEERRIRGLICRRRIDGLHKTNASNVETQLISLNRAYALAHSMGYFNHTIGGIERWHMLMRKFANELDMFVTDVQAIRTDSSFDMMVDGIVPWMRYYPIRYPIEIDEYGHWSIDLGDDHQYYGAAARRAYYAIVAWTYVRNYTCIGQIRANVDSILPVNMLRYVDESSSGDDDYAPEEGVDDIIPCFENAMDELDDSEYEPPEESETFVFQMENGSSSTPSVDTSLLITSVTTCTTPSNSPPLSPGLSPSLIDNLDGVRLQGLLNGTESLTRIGSTTQYVFSDGVTISGRLTQAYAKRLHDVGSFTKVNFPIKFPTGFQKMLNKEGLSSSPIGFVDNSKSLATLADTSGMSVRVDDGTQEQALVLNESPLERSDVSPTDPRRLVNLQIEPIEESPVKKTTRRTRVVDSKGDIEELDIVKEEYIDKTVHVDVEETEGIFGTLAAFASAIPDGISGIWKSMEHRFYKYLAKEVVDQCKEKLKTLREPFINLIIDGLTLLAAYKCVKTTAGFVLLAITILRRMFPNILNMALSIKDKIGTLFAKQDDSEPVWIASLLGLAVACKMFGWNPTTRDIIMCCSGIFTISKAAGPTKNMMLWFLEILPNCVSHWIKVFLGLPEESEASVYTAAADFVAKYRKLTIQERNMSTNRAQFVRDYTDIMQKWRTFSPLWKEQSRSLVRAILEGYKEEFTNSLTICGMNGPRRPPFVIYFFSPPGYGKSELSVRIPHELHKGGFWKDYTDAMGKFDDRSAIFTRQKTPFWDTYCGQPIVISDDFGATDDEPLLSELLNIKSPAYYCPNMASLNDPTVGVKGTPFTSELMIMSSNSIAMPTQGLNTPSALYRRRDMVIEVVADPEVIDKSFDRISSELINAKYGKLGIQTIESEYPHLSFNLFKPVSQKASTENLMCDGLGKPFKGLTLRQLTHLIHQQLLEYQSQSMDRTDKETFFDSEGLPLSWSDFYAQMKTHGKKPIDAHDCSRTCDACNALVVCKRCQECSRCAATKQVLGPDFNALDITVGKKIAEIRERHVCTENCKNCKITDGGVTLCTACSSCYLCKGNTISKAMKYYYSWAPFSATLAKNFKKLLGGLAVIGSLYGAWTWFSKQYAIEEKRFTDLVEDGMVTQSKEFLKEGDKRARSTQSLVQPVIKLANAGFRTQLGVAEDFNNVLYRVNAWIDFTTSDGMTAGGHCIRVKGSVIAFPLHYLLHLGNVNGIKKRMECRIYYHGSKYHDFHFDWESMTKVYSQKDGLDVMLDVCFYWLPIHCTVGKDNTAHILSGKDLDLVDTSFCYLQGVNKEGGQERISLSKVDIVKEFDAIQGVSKSYLTKGFKYYNSPTEAGDCFKCFVARVNGTFKICGGHVGNFTNTTPAIGKSVLITREMVDSIFSTKPEQGFIYQGQLPTVPEIGHLVPPDCSISICGRAELKDVVRLSEKTEILPSPLQYSKHCIDVPWKDIEKFPSILSPKDPRWTGPLTPLQQGLVKWKQPSWLIPREEIVIVSEWIYRDLNVIHPTLARVLTEEEAINGIIGNQYLGGLPMTSSDGWPFVLMRPSGEKGRGWLFTSTQPRRVKNPLLRKMLDEQIVLCKNRIIPGNVIIDCLKDENLKPGKTTRLFNNMSTVNLILMKQYFGAYAAHFSALHNASFPSVGINPRSQEWNLMFEYLRQVGTKGFDGDFKNWDGFMLHQMIIECVHIINRWYKEFDKKWKKEDDTVRVTLILDTFQGLHLALDLVYIILSGGPSGNYLTAVINCMVNYMQSMILFREVFPDATHDYWRSNVRMKDYGDDNLHCVSDLVCEHFNGVVMSALYGKRGIVYTPAAKTGEHVKYKSLDQLEYLKCTSRVDPIVGYYPVMSRTSVNTILNWVKTPKIAGVSLMDQAIINTNSALWFLYFEGKDIFYLYRDSVLRALAHYGIYDAAVLMHEEITAGLISTGAFEEILYEAEFVKKIDKDEELDVTGFTTQSNTVSPIGKETPIEQVGSTIEAANPPLIATNAMSPSNIVNVPSQTINDIALSYSSMARKLTKVTTFSWQASDATGNLIYVASVPYDLLTNCQQRSGFDKFYYSRFKTRITVLVQGTPFHQGLLACGFAPCITKNQFTAFQPGTDTTMFSNMICSYTSASAPLTAVYEIPFVHPENYIRLDDYGLDNLRGTLGTFAIQVMSPLLFSTGSSTILDVSIFVEFLECEFHCPKPIDACGVELDKRPVTNAPRIKIYKNPGVKVHVDEDLCLEGFETQGNKTSVNKVTNNTTNVCLSGGAKVNGGVDFGQNQAITSGDELDAATTQEISPQFEQTQGSTTMDSINGNMNPIPVQNRLIQDPNTCQQYQHNMKFSLYSSEIAPTAIAHLGFSLDEMLYQSLTSRYSLFVRIPWSTGDAAGTQLWGGYVLPSQINVNTRTPPPTDITTSVSQTYLDFLSGFHCFWRGDLQLKLIFVATPFATGALRLSVVFGSSDLTYTENESNCQYYDVIDLKDGKREYDITVPFVSTTPWKQCTSTYKTKIPQNNIMQFSTGVMGIHIINKLSVGSGAPTSLEILGFISAPNIQFAWLKPSQVVPTIEELASDGFTQQMQQGTMLGATVPKKVSDFGNQDTVYGSLNYGAMLGTGGLKPDNKFSNFMAYTSFRDLVKKQYPILRQTIGAANSNSTKATFAEDLIMNPSTPFGLLSSMFIGWRGGLRWKFISTTSYLGSDTATQQANSIMNMAGMLWYVAYWPSWTDVPLNAFDIGDPSGLVMFTVIDQNNHAAEFETSFTTTFNFLINPQYYGGATNETYYRRKGTIILRKPTGSFGQDVFSVTGGGADDFRFVLAFGPPPCTVTDIYQDPDVQSTRFSSFPASLQVQGIRPKVRNDAPSRPVKGV